MPSASLGAENPLPDIKPTADLHATIEIDRKTVTEEESRYMGWGNVNSILPYMIQDGYNRKKEARQWKAAVMENDYIRAMFLPELGGRLWSLIDKTTGRELLHRNPVFQPCNLALRNAWISGGVEWNIGMIGHSPFTVDHVYAEALTLADKTPVLRLYQYERVRRLIYRVEAILPDDSPHLYVRVRIDNTSDQETAVYWWSNIAVDERDDVRVIVPANQAFRYGYGDKLAKIKIPDMTINPKVVSQPVHSASSGADDSGTDDEADRTCQIDISRSRQISQSMDFFFDLPENQNRWIAAVGGDGYGFGQTSTPELRGRKLFVWGQGTGGQNWQTFLAQPGCSYIEIQAGLARTQLEHLPMKGSAVISWMETYGPITTNQHETQGSDWQAAIQAVEQALAVSRPPDRTQQMQKRVEKEIDGQPGELLHSAEGWASVQKALLGDDFNNTGLMFPVSDNNRKEQLWLELAQKGELKCPDPLDKPESYQIGPEWEHLLIRAVEAGQADHWFGHYHLGVMQAASGKFDEAEKSFQRSLDSAENPWALRCMSILRQLRDEMEPATALLVQAVKMLCEPHLVKEALALLLQTEKPEMVIEIYHSLPASVRELGRIKVLFVQALLDCRQLDEAAAILEGNLELSDVREGEVMLSDLWFRLCAMQRGGTGRQDDPLLETVRQSCPLPAHLDFRMMV